AHLRVPSAERRRGSSRRSPDRQNLVIFPRAFEIRAAELRRRAFGGILGTTTSNEAEEPQPGFQMTWANRAVLLVDIGAGVRLMEQDEVSLVSRWLALVEHVKTQVLPECGGHLAKTLGDGMLLDFDDVRSAVSAAFAIMHASNRGNVGRPPEQQILLRIGME